MKIKYKEFYTEFRGDIDIMPEKEITCNSYKEIANKILELLNNVKPGYELKIISVDLNDDTPNIDWEAGIIPLIHLEE